MGSPDWYRTSAWDDEAQADFDARLARAQGHNRPQYLRIKALSLREAGDTAGATRLLSRVLDEYPESLDAAFCAELLGDLALESRDFRSAEAHYRESLRLRPDQNATTGEVHVGLAEALVAQGRHEEALEALEHTPLGGMKLNHAVCRWNATFAEAAHAVGDQQVAASAAARAVALLDAPDQFSRHPGVGRAALSDERVRRLRGFVSGDAPAHETSKRWFRGR